MPPTALAVDGQEALRLAELHPDSSSQEQVPQS